MKEIVVISGKGGTGKTSLTAAFAALASSAVLADCDVDASDLHLVLTPTVKRRETFSGGSRAMINPAACNHCGACQRLCRYDAVRCVQYPSGERFEIDDPACEGCGVCARFCPVGAIVFAPAINGEWMISETRFGPMAHARLEPGSENSGKLVTLVRQHARRLAEEQQRELIIADGPPGVACPVIASLTGADAVLLVAEPTPSGSHDVRRARELARRFGLQVFLTVNRWDINSEITEELEAWAAQDDVTVVGRVRNDRAVTEAQKRGVTIVEHTNSGAGADARAVWEKVEAALRCGVKQ